MLFCVCEFWTIQKNSPTMFFPCYWQIQCKDCNFLRCNTELAFIMCEDCIWATTWQNQQNECAPSEDSDQHGHPPSLIRVFAVRMKKPCVLSYPLCAKWRLWSDWVDAQADRNLRWAHTHFVGFVMSWLIYLRGNTELVFIMSRSGLYIFVLQEYC